MVLFGKMQEKDTINHVLFQCTLAFQSCTLSLVPSELEITSTVVFFSNFDYFLLEDFFGFYGLFRKLKTEKSS